MSIWGAMMFLCSSTAVAGKLGDTSDVVGDDDDDDDDDRSFCFFCFLFSGADDDDDVAVDDDSSGSTTRRNSRFLPFPYARNQAGYAIVQEERYDTVTDPDTGEVLETPVSTKITPDTLQLHDGKAVAGRAFGAYRYDVGGVHLTDVRLGVDYAGRVGMQLRWTEFMEPADGEWDHLTLVDMMLRAPIVTAHQGLFHLGVGAMVMHYDENTRFGAYGALQVRIFPLRPLIMGADLQVGYLNQAVYIRGELTVGAILGPAELFAGYDTQMFLGEHDSVFYHGPGVGLRFWF